MAISASTKRSFQALTLVNPGSATLAWAQENGKRTPAVQRRTVLLSAYPAGHQRGFLLSSCLCVSILTGSVHTNHVPYSSHFKPCRTWAVLSATRTLPSRNCTRIRFSVWRNHRPLSSARTLRVKHIWTIYMWELWSMPERFVAIKRQMNAPHQHGVENIE
jgi:hypothetical protein